MYVCLWYSLSIYECELVKKIVLRTAVAFAKYVDLQCYG